MVKDKVWSHHKSYNAMIKELNRVYQSYKLVAYEFSIDVHTYTIFYFRRRPGTWPRFKKINGKIYSKINAHRDKNLINRIAEDNTYGKQKCKILKDSSKRLTYAVYVYPKRKYKM